MTSSRHLFLIPALLLLAIPLAASAEDEPEPPTLEDVLDRMKDRDRTIRLSGVSDAVQVFDKAVTTLLIKYLKDKDYSIRMAAIESLRTRCQPAEMRKAAAALCVRMKALVGKVSEVEEYRNIISVLHDLAQPGSVNALVDMSLEEPVETAEARLMAVGNTPCAEAVESLIDIMSKGRRRGSNRQRDFAVKALVYATGEKLGRHPDDWRAWWKGAKRTFDFEAAAQAREDERQAIEDKARQAEEKRARREEREKERERKRAERGGGNGGEGDGDGEEPAK